MKAILIDKRLVIRGAALAAMVMLSACGGGSDEASSEGSSGGFASKSSAMVEATATPEPAQTWVTIAPHYGMLVLDSPQVVRFGRDTRWVERTIVRNLYCGESSFGEDPAPGEYKVCQALQGNTSSGSGPVPSSPVITRYNATSGGATIAWTPPNTLADGSVSKALKALTVYHGTQLGQQGPGGAGTMAANVPLNTTQLSLNLPSGTQWIAMTATNAAGESSSSPEIKVSIP